ncbi:keto-deoxy-phosphogluconate aldolase [Candidatus Puniceispirillum sp.]|nr:keto-deoxy-phosphogluconate aldolase [Candidatus Puniceispirillum sp.]
MAKLHDRVAEVQERIRRRSAASQIAYLDEIMMMRQSPDSNRRQISCSNMAHAAKEAGAHFAVSPGTTQAVIDGCEAADLPLLPGASTVSEMMHLLEAGFTTMKFFPASAAGGTSLIRSLTSPLPQIKICPTGDISAISAPEWLALPNVECVGGSWVAPQNLINAGDFAAIEALATEAASLTG